MLQLKKIIKKNSRKIIGIMSGTSCDGLDIALVEVSSSGKGTGYKLLDAHHAVYDEKVKNYLKQIMTQDKGHAAEISQANFFLAKLWSDAINSFLKKTGLTLADIDLIGSHGQTVYHQPTATRLFDYQISSTLQIGDPAVIAQLTGITTIGDFRVADVALGGQGAPLVPYFDWLSFSKYGEDSLVLNIGGIANFTFVPADGDLNSVIAFDTGPGNMLIDQLMQRLYEKPLDHNGKIAFKGQFSQRLFDYLIK
jgi:anhydro-N-acetylmuramic acid kinase